MLLEDARRRAEVFSRLKDYLRKAVEVVKGLDPSAEVYLFGSVAEGRWLLSSDIDVLIVTDLRPEVVISRLWEAGLSDPFEFHVIERGWLDAYRRRARLVRVDA
ncbi:MAG: nucleotidyltransferase domain-containing protein [Acidilobus sp.]